MKKKSTLALIMVLMLASVMMLSACVKPSVVTTTEGLAEYFDKINDSTNFTGKLTISQSYDGTSIKGTIELKQDGNKIRISMKEFYGGETFEELVYIEIDEEHGVVYGYLKNYRTGEWKKQEIDLNAISSDIQMMLDLELLQEELFGLSDNALFNAENYIFSEEDDCFIFNEEGFDNDVLDEIKFTVKITEDRMTFNLIPEVDSEYARSMKIKVEFRNFGETTVRIPNVK